MPESINSGNVFSSHSLTEYMTASLPSTPTTPDQHLRDPYDALALLSHACMIAFSFRLTGLGDGQYPNIPKTSPASSPVLPPEWNQSPDNSYLFRYTHDQSSLTYLLKITRLGSKALIAGLTLPDEHQVHSIDVSVREYLSPSAFPLKDLNPTHEAETRLKLQESFLSAGRICDLASLLKLHLIQKLAPSLQKEGYEESAHAASTAAQRSREPERRGRDPPPEMPPYAQPRPFDDPLAAGPPRRPFPAGDFPPPGFDDEYEMNRPPGFAAGPYGGARRPLTIGERDLYPPGLGPHDPLRMGPGGGNYGGGGMHPTFDDPMFGGGGAGGEWGSGGRAPPGARYDPVGPGDGPPMGGMGRFPGGRGGGRGVGGPFGGGPGGPFGGGFGGHVI